MPRRAVDHRLRVMIVASGDLWAGAEAQVLTLAGALHARADVAVSVVVFNEGELARRLRAAGVSTWCLDEVTLRTPAMIRGMFSLIRKLQPDVVHTHRGKENVLGGFFAWLMGRASVRTVHGLEEHTVAAEDRRRRVLRLADRLVARHCQQAIVAVSDDLALRLRERFAPERFPETEVLTILNGIDVDAVRAAARAELPAGSESVFAHSVLEPAITEAAPLHVGTLGRLVPIKRLDLFIDVAAHLSQSCPGRFRFHVVGDGPEANALAAKAAATTRPGTITFHGFQTNPLPLLSRLKALVFTSDYEGLPMTALESLALGVPVVSRDVGGLRVLHDRGADVSLAATDDVAGIANAVLAVAGRTTGARLPNEFTASHCAQRYLELYERATRARAGNAVESLTGRP